MNCSKCGEEIREAAEYRCEKCTKKAQIEELRNAEEISPKNAILVMMKDETIIRELPYGYIKVKWNGSGFETTDHKGDRTHNPDSFNGFRIVRKRPMTRYEILAWASSEESRGWFVNIRLKGDDELQGDWQFPMHFKYDNYEDTADDIYEYVRARLRSDLSGIDENTIQGFEVEEE
jgi:hypothetical protein